MRPKQRPKHPDNNTKTQFAAVDLNKQAKIKSHQLNNILIRAVIKNSREESPTKSSSANNWSVKATNHKITLHLVCEGIFMLKTRYAYINHV